MNNCSSQAVAIMDLEGNVIAVVGLLRDDSGATVLTGNIYSEGFQTFNPVESSGSLGETFSAIGPQLNDPNQSSPGYDRCGWYVDGAAALGATQMTIDVKNGPSCSPPVGAPTVGATFTIVFIVAGFPVIQTFTITAVTANGGDQYVITFNPPLPEVMAPGDFIYSNMLKPATAS